MAAFGRQRRVGLGMSLTTLNPTTLAAVADQCVELASYIEEWGEETPWMKNAPLGNRLHDVQQAAALFARVLRDLADEVERLN
jgi:hypothetical protein